MTIRLIGPEMIRGFHSLDPFQRLYYLKLPGFNAIGITDGEGKNAVPVGVLLYSEIKDRITIEWIYVAEDRRGYGYGELMMKALFTLAGKKKDGSLFAYHIRHAGMNRVLPNVEGYFLEHYFFDETMIAGEWNIKLKDLDSLSFGILAVHKKGVHYRSFDKLKPNIQSMVIKSMLENKDTDLFADIRGGVIARGTSVVCEADGKFGGAAVFMEIAGSPVLAGLYAIDGDIAGRLLAEAMFLAEEIYPGDKGLHISLRSPKYKRALEIISDGRCTPAVLKGAYATDYFAG